MHELIAEIGTFIAANREWAWPVVGLLSFILSLAVVGIAITAPPVMIAVGGLIAAGVIDPVPVIASAAIGSMLGFVASYFAGRWLGPGVVHRWPLKNYRTAVARSRLVFRRYAMFAVFICRFFGPLRVTIPLIAGVTGMNQHRFHAANIVSALIWAPVMMAPGWLAGKGMGAMFEDVGEAHPLAVVVAGLALAGLVVAIGFKLQRDRLAKLKRRRNRLMRQQKAVA